MWRNTALKVTLFLVLVACARGPTLIATGETLDVIGRQFLTAGERYDRLWVSGRMTRQRYEAWADFVPKFQRNYERAVQLWQTAKAHEGTTTQDTIILINDLKSQILYYYMDSLELGGP